jgi:hypothetical protein
MKRLWLITNPASGSAGGEKCAAIEAVCAERGLSFVGRTEFPAQGLPSVAVLNTANADTALLFAGDGTINAALRALEGWNGAVLILPGGTMNMLAKRLHGEANAGTIVGSAHQDQRAFVGMIAGPVTAWAEAREAAREGDLAGVPAKAAAAWSRSWEHDIALHDGDTLRGQFNMVFAEPSNGGVAVSGIAADGMADIVKLGWAWIAGDWRAAQPVEVSLTQTAILSSGKPIRALFDGEEARLASPAVLQAGTSGLRFLTTIPTGTDPRPVA